MTVESPYQARQRVPGQARYRVVTNAGPSIGNAFAIIDAREKRHERMVVTRRGSRRRFRYRLL